MSDIADQQEINRLNARIEALVKERDAALSVRPSMQEWIDHHYARAEAAEAEVERLTAALHSITLSYEERCGIDHATLARSALEAKP